MMKRLLFVTGVRSLLHIQTHENELNQTYGGRAENWKQTPVGTASAYLCVLGHTGQVGRTPAFVGAYRLVGSQLEQLQHGLLFAGLSRHGQSLTDKDEGSPSERREPSSEDNSRQTYRVSVDILDVDLCSVGHQQVDDLAVTFSGRHHQARLSRSSDR